MKAEARVLRSALMFGRLRKQALEKEVDVKGFLGPSLRENPSVPSLGRRSALSRGLIVDDAGKLRCPAGTPNANQFTDLQMSNCMIPSAETAINEAVDAVGNAVQSISRLEKGETPTLAKHDPSPDAARIRAENSSILESIKAQGGQLDGPTEEFIESNKEGLYALSSGLHTNEKHTAQRRVEIRDAIEFLQEAARDKQDNEPLTLEETKEIFANMGRNVTIMGGTVGRFMGTEDDRRKIVRGLQLTLFGGQISEDVKRDGVAPRVIEMLRTASPEDIEQELEKSVRAFHEGIDPRVHVQIPSSRIDSVFTDGRYKTTHEARSEHSGPDVRRSYEVTLGIPSDASSDIRPASGYVVHKDWTAVKTTIKEKKKAELNSDKVDVGLISTPVAPEGPVGIYGDVTVRLKPELSERTRYGWGDSFNNMIDPVAMASGADIDEISNALLSRRFKNSGRDKNTTTVLTFLDASLHNDFSRMRSKTYMGESTTSVGGPTDDNYAEALIMGSFDLADIEEIELAFDSMPWMPKEFFPQASYNTYTQENADEFADSMAQILDKTMSVEQLRAMGASDEEIEMVQKWIDEYMTWVRTTQSPRLPSRGSALFDYRSNKALEAYLSMLSMSEFKDIADKNGIKLTLTSPNGIDRWKLENYSESDQKIGDIKEIWRRRVTTAVIEDARSKIEWSKRPRENTANDF